MLPSICQGGTAGALRSEVQRAGTGCMLAALRCGSGDAGRMLNSSYMSRGSVLSLGNNRKQLAGGDNVVAALC